MKDFRKNIQEFLDKHSQFSLKKLLALVLVFTTVSCIPSASFGAASVIKNSFMVAAIGPAIPKTIPSSIPKSIPSILAAPSFSNQTLNGAVLDTNNQPTFNIDTSSQLSFGFRVNNPSVTNKITRKIQDASFGPSKGIYIDLPDISNANASTVYNYNWNYKDGSGNKIPNGTYVIIVEYTDSVSSHTMQAFWAFNITSNPKSGFTCSSIVTPVDPADKTKGVNVTWAASLEGASQNDLSLFTFNWTFSDGGTGTGTYVSKVYTNSTSSTKTIKATIKTSAFFGESTSDPCYAYIPNQTGLVKYPGSSADTAVSSSSGSSSGGSSSSGNSGSSSGGSSSGSSDNGGSSNSGNSGSGGSGSSGSGSGSGSSGSGNSGSNYGSGSSIPNSGTESNAGSSSGSGSSSDSSSSGYLGQNLQDSTPAPDVMSCKLINSSLVLSKGGQSVLRCTLKPPAYVTIQVIKGTYNPAQAPDSANIMKTYLYQKPLVNDKIFTATWNGIDNYDQPVEEGDYSFVAWAQMTPSSKADISIQKFKVMQDAPAAEDTGDQTHASADTQVQTQATPTQANTLEQTPPPAPVAPPAPPEPSKCPGVNYPSDIATHWAADAIKTGYDACIFKGYADGTFHPDQPMTRFEATKTVLATRGVPPKLGCYTLDCGSPFTDLRIEQGSWIRAAYDQKIVQGVSKNKFAPNALITRAQASSLLVRAFGIQPHKGCYSANCGAGYPSNFFLDVVDSWQGPYIRALWDLGVITGTAPNTFEPDRPLTRAEMATLVMKVKNKK